MSKRPWYKRYPADFIAGTLMLNIEEKGAYSVLLDLMYDRGGPIPDDAKWLASVMGCSTRRWSGIRKRLVDLGKIDVRGVYLTNNRALSQSKVEDLEHQKLVENGAKASRIPVEAKTHSNENNDLEEKGLKPNGSGGLEHTRGRTSASQKLEATSKQESVAADDAARVARAVEVGRKVTDLMGVTDDPRWLGNWTMVQAWLNEGFNPESDILPTVATIVEKLKRSSRSMPKTLNYFTGAIRENNKIRCSSGVSPVNANTGREFCEVPTGSPAGRAWIAKWKAEGRKTTWLEQQRSITVPTEYPPVGTA